jgi:hypothetical protein
MISYEFNAAPLMQLVDANVPLPFQDHIWEYPSAEKVVAEQKSPGILPARVHLDFLCDQQADDLYL